MRFFRLVFWNSIPFAILGCYLFIWLHDRTITACLRISSPLTMTNTINCKWRDWERGTEKLFLRKATQLLFRVVYTKTLPGRNCQTPLTRGQTAELREAPPLSPRRRRASRLSANRKSCSPSALGVSDLALPVGFHLLRQFSGLVRGRAGCVSLGPSVWTFHPCWRWLSCFLVEAWSVAAASGVGWTALSAEAAEPSWDHGECGLRWPGRAGTGPQPRRVAPEGQGRFVSLVRLWVGRVTLRDTELLVHASWDFVFSHGGRAFVYTCLAPNTFSTLLRPSIPLALADTSLLRSWNIFVLFSCCVVLRRGIDGCARKS